jgi:pSer/pThr/pTyr-binding forkhead associated (FHA) protein
MRLILEVVSGPLAGKRIAAEERQVVRIGRTPEADVAMSDTFMSGQHFAIECDLEGCRLRDLNSRNGTKLNGEMINKAALSDGDRVYAGRTDFIVRIEPDAAKVGPPAVAPKRPAAARPISVARKSASSGKRVTKLPTESGVNPSTRSTGPKAGSASSRSSKQVRRVPELASGSESEKFPAVKKSTPMPPVKSEPSSPPVPDRAKKTEPEPLPRAQRPAPAAPPAIVPANALDSYEAATPAGRLLHILSGQPQKLMALIDAIRDVRMLELLRSTRGEYQALYRSEQHAAIAPYLVFLPPRSELLRRMIQEGWGHGWGVYLTCPLPLTDLREYFRTSLMVTLPDGMELFSRFYDPAFFRVFLETCTAAEAVKFFGPVTSYFMEETRPEILLQFVRSSTGAEKRGHLLSVLP